MTYRLAFARAGLVLLALCASPVIHAQAYPDRPVKLIVPSGPGGGYDFVARVLSDKLSETLGQPLVVENRAGAGTTLGTQVALAAPADGYTLMMGGISNIVFNSALYKSLPYDPIKEFVPISLVAKYPYTMVASKGLPLNTLGDIIAYARSNPDKLSIATVGTGTGQQVLAAVLMSMANIRMLQVPYKSAQAVYPDLISGRVDLFIDATPGARPHIDSGRVKGVVSVSTERTAAYPDLPGTREAGLPGFALDSWYGLFARKGTPPAVIERLRAAAGKALSDPEMRARLEGNGAEVLQLNPQQTQKFVEAEYTKWTALIRQAGITAD